MKVYLPLLKESAEDYNQIWGKGKAFKAMKHEIIKNGIPVTMRGQAWPLLIRNKLRINSNLYEFYKNYKTSPLGICQSEQQENSLIDVDIPRTFPDLNNLFE